MSELQGPEARILAAIHLSRDLCLASPDAAALAERMVREGSIPFASEEVSRILDVAPTVIDSLADLAAPGAPTVVGLSESLRGLLAGVQRLRQGAGPELPEIPREAFAPAQRYVRQGVLGEGAMGVVYLALDQALGRPVALKVMKPFAGRSAARAQERFLREARTVARLRHAGIVAVHDVGQDGGAPYLAMEYVEGTTLEARLWESERLRARDGGLPPARRAEDLAIYRGIAEAVGYAHSQGVVHRDLKPGNVLIDREGRPRVADFGLARDFLGSDEVPRESLTESGAIIGTPFYMSPELASGVHDVGPPSDVYSLGVVLYRLLSGGSPYRSTAMRGLLDEIARVDPEPPRRVDRGVPRPLEAVCLRCLEKDPRKRYPHAGALADDLGRFQAGEPVEASAPGLLLRLGRRVRRHPRAAAVVAALAIASVVVAAVLGFGAVRRHRDIQALLADARAAEAEGRPDRAAGLFSQVEALDPDRGEAVAGSARNLALTRDAERRATAERHLAAARDAELEIHRIRERIDRLVEEREDLEEIARPWDPDEAKQPLWAIERELGRATHAAESLDARRLEAYLQAFGADPGDSRARTALAAIHYQALEAAELAGNHAEAERLAVLVKIYDDGTYDARLSVEGVVSIDSDPPGAEASLFRYEPGDDLRLVPEPAGEDLRCPIEGKSIPVGSYLLVLRSPGRAETRFPFLVRRGKRDDLRVRLFTPAEVGPGFVHVPAGVFIMGGGSSAEGSFPVYADRFLPDFAISRFEVTMAEYLEFLNDRDFHTAEEAWRRAPRQSAVAEPLCVRQGERLEMSSRMRGDHPAFGVSWHDATAYGVWRTSRSKAAGEGSVYRLPTCIEWEKAARGGDGRTYPWGDHFDFAFCRGLDSCRCEVPHYDAVGHFARDESPYGVRDLAGNLKEWCSSWMDDDVPERRLFRALRGGSWDEREEVYFRTTSWVGEDPEAANMTLGFRIVKELPR